MTQQLTSTDRKRPLAVAFWDVQPGSAETTMVRAPALLLHPVATSAELNARLADPELAAVVIRIGSQPASFTRTIRSIRSKRPEVEVLCTGDNTLLDQLSREYDGFVPYSPDPTEFARTIRLVLDRCCARKNRNHTVCRHTKRPACA